VSINLQFYCTCAGATINYVTLKVGGKCTDSVIMCGIVKQHRPSLR